MFNRISINMEGGEPHEWPRSAFTTFH